MANADQKNKVDYIEGDVTNLIERCNLQIKLARLRSDGASAALRDAVLDRSDPEEWTVAAQIEVLCSRLGEAANEIGRLSEELRIARDQLEHVVDFTGYDSL